MNVVTDNSVNSEERYHTFWRRFWAALLDSAAIAPFVWFDRFLWNSTSSPMMLLGWSTFYQAVAIFYSVGLLFLFGQTPGKMATGVVIVNVNGGKISLAQAILRNIVGVILAPVFMVVMTRNIFAGRIENRGLGELQFVLLFGFAAMIWAVLEFVTMLFNSRRRAIHDFIAGTVVVRQPIEERVPHYLMLRWILIALVILNGIVPRLQPERNLQIKWREPAKASIR